MKKPIALLLTLLLVVSLTPGTFAESGSGSDGTDDTDDAMDDRDVDVRHFRNDDTRGREVRVTDEDGNERRIRQVQHRNEDGDVTTRTRGRAKNADGDERRFDRRVKRDADGTVVDARTRFKNADGEIRSRWKVRDGEPSTEFRERVKMARDHQQDVRERYHAARDKYKETREKFRNAREQWNECKGDDGEACTDLRERYHTHATEHLLRAAEALLKQLERIENFLESHVDDEEKLEELLAELEEVRDQVESTIERVEGLGDDASPEELKAAAGELREAWKQVKEWSKKIAHRVADHRLGKLAQRLEHAEEKFWHARDRLKEAGADVAWLDELLDDFSATLDNLAEENDKSMFREAVQLAKDILKEIRELKGSLGDVDDTAGEE